MKNRSGSGGLGLLTAPIVLFGGLAVVLYAMGLTEVAVIPTLGAVATAATAVHRVFQSMAIQTRDATTPAKHGAIAETESSSEETIA